MEANELCFDLKQPFSRPLQQAIIDVTAMCQQCREVVVEAEDLHFDLNRAGTATTATTATTGALAPGCSGGARGVKDFAEALLQICGEWVVRCSTVQSQQDSRDDFHS